MALLSLSVSMMVMYLMVGSLIASLSAVSLSARSVRAGEVVRVVDGVRMLPKESVSSTMLDELEDRKDRSLTGKTDVVRGWTVLDFLFMFQVDSLEIPAEHTPERFLSHPGQCRRKVLKTLHPFVTVNAEEVQSIEVVPVGLHQCALLQNDEISVRNGTISTYGQSAG